MGWNLKGNDSKLMSDINITPLTDVMLVLLVIFMVTTPLIMIESFKIKLPKAISADAEPGKGVVISISENGLISVDGKSVPGDSLLSELKRLFAQGREKTVVLKADASTRHRFVIEALDAARLAGAAKLSIATEHASNDKR